MTSAIAGVNAFSVSLLLGAVFRLHYLRAKIATAVLSDLQFERFQQEGLAGSGLNDPSRLFFEYRFIRDILRSSNLVTSARLLKSWIFCCRFLFAAVIFFAVVSIFSVFLT